MLTEPQLVQLYGEHTRPLYGYVSRRVGGDRALAEDVVQEAWLRAVAAWRRSGAPAHPRAWLIRVARNLLASYFRRPRPRLVDPDELETEDDRLSPETPSAAALVHWGLSRLRRRQAALLEAFYFEHKSTREIAAEYSVTERAIEGRLRRARRELEKRLRPYLSQDDTLPVKAAPAVDRAPVAAPVEGGNTNA